MSDTSPLSTPSLSRSLALNFFNCHSRLLPHSSFSPTGEHAEQLNNFSIYMHGGMRYHWRALRHFDAGKHTPMDTQPRQRPAVQFTLAASIRRQQLVITVTIERKEFRCCHTQINCLFQLFATGHYRWNAD